jgi:hypothetical protein
MQRLFRQLRHLWAALRLRRVVSPSTHRPRAIAIAGLQQIMAHIMHPLLLILNSNLTHNLRLTIKLRHKLKHMGINKRRHEHITCSKPEFLVEPVAPVIIMAAVH